MARSEFDLLFGGYFQPTVRGGGSRHYSRFVLALEFMKDEAKAKKRHFYHRDEDDVW